MSKPKILLVENSNIVLGIEKRYLADAGVSLFTAADSDEALRTARKIKPDLVYLAFGVPGMGGIACCRAIRSDPKLGTVPVVMVCATSEELQLSRAAGCDAVVAKPIDRREFLDAGLSLIPKTASLGERMACRNIVACSVDKETFYGTIEDISSMGMFVGSAREATTGDLLNVLFILPWFDAVPIRTQARVNWVNSSRRRRNDRLPPGFGVLFQGIEPAAITQIKAYMRFVKDKVG